MQLGLVGRILASGAVVLVLLILELALVVRSIESVRSATRSEHRAEQSVVAAVRVEKLVVDLESGARGYAITHDARFLDDRLNDGPNILPIIPPRVTHLS